MVTVLLNVKYLANGKDRAIVTMECEQENRIQGSNRTVRVTFESRFVCVTLCAQLMRDVLAKVKFFC